MTLSVSTQAGPVAAKLVLDTDADEQAKNNVTNTTGDIYLIDVDNTSNGAQAVYLKLYDALVCSPGTTEPDMIIPITAGNREVLSFVEGKAFSTGISYCCVTAGGTSGTTGPTNAVTVRIVTS